LEKIKRIVREEMNAIGGQELVMTALQKKSTWETTGRWDDEVVDIWFKTQLKDGTDLGLGWSHEEPIVEMLKQYLASYKDLPINVYQFQTKLRNELRAKSGIMRGREFVMKDMYSCSLDADQHEKFYQATIDAYKKIYDRIGIGQDTYVTFASGGAFTQFSHEFQTLCDAGEDTVYLHREKNIAVNEEVLDDGALSKLGIKREELEKVTTAEVGNIFNFGIQKSKEMDFTFTNESGEKQYVHLGSYGIGITRVMGVVVEKFADEKGIVWPESIAPFKVHLISLGEGEKDARKLYDELTQKDIEVFWDDRGDVSAGEKFADADLLGMPWRIVVSDKSLAAGGYELKGRTEKDSKVVSHKELLNLLTTTDERR
ncbi:MAG TPA: aminoacyl--tRNA ligase-related protein, partial [Candidatus Paceibacterota bacterium]|nr:aminoacyl--tRNA ligase-related protein [Candidatus Paceibacterota bacterium]